MSIYMNRQLRARKAEKELTTDERVRAALDDPAQREQLIQRTKRTVSLMRNLIGRDPHELAYTIIALKDEEDLGPLLAYIDLTNLTGWVAAAKTIVHAEPEVRDAIDDARRRRDDTQRIRALLSA